MTAMCKTQTAAPAPALSNMATTAKIPALISAPMDRRHDARRNAAMECRSGKRRATMATRPTAMGAAAGVPSRQAGSARRHLRPRLLPHLLVRLCRWLRCGHGWNGQCMAVGAGPWRGRWTVGRSRTTNSKRAQNKAEKEAAEAKLRAEEKVRAKVTDKARCGLAP